MLSLDHHCLFLTRCVAVNNHRSFVFFMIETMLANALFVRTAISCKYNGSEVTFCLGLFVVCLEVAWSSG